MFLLYTTNTTTTTTTTTNTTNDNTNNDTNTNDNTYTNDLYDHNTYIYVYMYIQLKDLKPQNILVDVKSSTLKLAVRAFRYYIDMYNSRNGICMNPVPIFCVHTTARGARESGTQDRL